METTIFLLVFCVFNTFPMGGHQCSDAIPVETKEQAAWEFYQAKLAVVRSNPFPGVNAQRIEGRCIRVSIAEDSGQLRVDHQIEAIPVLSFDGQPGLPDFPDNTLPVSNP